MSFETLLDFGVYVQVLCSSLLPGIRNKLPCLNIHRLRPFAFLARQQRSNEGECRALVEYCL